MHIAITPYYNDIFDEDIPQIQKLISDIPTRVIVTYLSYVNAKLHHKDSIENQFAIINEMLRRQNVVVKNKIKENLMRFVGANINKSKVGLVTKLHLLSLMHYALCNYTDFEFEDTTPEQELNIFKAYLVIVDQKANEYSETYLRERQVGEGNFFPKNTWPVLLKQIEATPRYDPIADLIKAICFFNFLEYHSKYTSYVKGFLNSMGYKNTWEYVLSLMNIISQKFINERENGKTPYSINCDDKTKPLYESLCLNPQKYSKAFKEKEENHSFMKKTPLYKFGDMYVVIDWSFFYNKLYDGLIFDFFNRSGIKKENELDTIPKFKKFIGKEITECFTFQKLLSGIFFKKYSTLLFPIDDSNGEPDAYYREGNKIILFEIKDSFFSGGALTSSSYKQIESEIDKKYNNSKKGTGQLLKQIQRLRTASLEHKSYTELKRNPRNFIIYPVIIYTDTHFGMPGVNNYLCQEFEKKLALLDLKNSFRRIEKLTFLNLGFIIKYYGYIKGAGLVNILEMIQHELEKRKKKHLYRTEVDFLFRYNSPPENIFEEIIDCGKDEMMDLKELAMLLNLTEGLPK